MNDNRGTQKKSFLIKIPNRFIRSQKDMSLSVSKCLLILLTYATILETNQFPFIDCLKSWTVLVRDKFAPFYKKRHLIGLYSIWLSVKYLFFVLLRYFNSDNKIGNQLHYQTKIFEETSFSQLYGQLILLPKHGSSVGRTLCLLLHFGKRSKQANNAWRLLRKTKTNK